MNTVNEERPESFEYTPDRTVQSGVDLRTDSLECCTCADGCRDRFKCACWQLTLSEAALINNKHSVGYVNHRLKRYQHSA